MKPTAFTHDAALRIRRTVRRMEGLPVDNGQGETGGLLIPRYEIQRYVFFNSLIPGTGPTHSQAYRVWWDRDAGDFQYDDSDTIDVYDLSGRLRVPAFDADTWKRWIGRATQLYDNGYWEILDQPQYGRIVGQATADVDPGDATFTIDHVRAIVGVSPVTDDTDTVTVQNSFGDSIDEDDEGVAEYDPTQPEWRSDGWPCGTH